MRVMESIIQISATAVSSTVECAELTIHLGNKTAEQRHAKKGLLFAQNPTVHFSLSYVFFTLVTQFFPQVTFNLFYTS